MNAENKKRYKPKRKVNNKQSERIPHIMGGFYSNKMQQIVNFESLRENMICKILELSRIVKEYYVQPVAVPVKVYDSTGDLISWKHIPDALVFAEGMAPCLYQIKAIRETKNRKIENIKRACCHYASKSGWDYRVIHPWELDDILRSNIEFAFPFRNVNCTSKEITENIRFALRNNGEMNLSSLARINEPAISRFKVLPVIYHELAIGRLYTDMLKPISSDSLIGLATDSDYDLYDYVLELK